MSIFPVILCGGSGTRLWPLSRQDYPKQFLKLTGELSLLQQTCRRLKDDLYAAPTLLGNHEHRFVMAEQLMQIGVGPCAIVLEPAARNTAPAAVTAALIMAKKNRDALVLLLPSDHAVRDVKSFTKSVMAGVEAARNGGIVTFGVRADSPETGYGYIHAPGDSEILDVTRFVEKPDIATAQGYVDDGDYFWNAGIFLYSANKLIEIYREIAPEILTACEQALALAHSDLDFLRLDKKSYGAAPCISFDYAIMEKIQNIKCIPLKTPWSDLGTWSAIWREMEKDAAGNACLGEVMLHETRGSYAHSMDGARLVLVGLDDIIAIATRDTILITSKDRAQDVKAITGHLENEGSGQSACHSRRGKGCKS